MSCQDYTFPVTLSATDPTPYQLFGRLCARAGDLSDGQTVQLLINGATYNLAYWDFSLNPARYSYARTVAAAGIPTFAIDPIGAGHSSHPPGLQVTIAAQAFVIHQVVAALGSGSIGGTQFGKVITVGHSFGSQIAAVEALTYHDVAGLILTGFTHHPTDLATHDLAANVHPANQDPSPTLQALHLDDLYVTTLPGVRDDFFYNPADADPAVIAEDERTKDAFSVAQAAGPADTSAIDVPVLAIVGSQDRLFCGTTAPCTSWEQILANEGPFYSSKACLQAVAVPDAGHSIALHLNAAVEDVAAIVWSDAFVRSGRPPSKPCVPGALQTLLQGP